MEGRAIDGVAYLGGHLDTPTQSPVDGRLRVTTEALIFEVMGEYFETLFQLRWANMDGWEASGSGAANERTSAAGVLVGAVLAGLPGALIGSFSKTRDYQATLVCLAGSHRVAFAISSIPAATVESILRGEPAAARVAGTPADVATVWEYRVCGLEELDALGQHGWEAVSVWVETAPRVLLKHRK